MAISEPKSGVNEHESIVTHGCLCPHQGHTPPCPQGTLRGPLYLNLLS
jgi:hypothetical protein